MQCSPCSGRHGNAGCRTRLWKCQASDGAIRELRPGDGSGHFPYVCLSDGAAALRLPWLAVGASQDCRLPLPLPPGRHDLLVLVNPERDVLEPQECRTNNGVRLWVEGEPA